MRLPQFLRKPWVTFVLRGLIGFIFIYGGVAKLLDLAGFAEAISNYRLLPQVLLHPATLLLPWVEVVAGVAVFTGVLLRGGAALLAALLTLFTAAVAISMASGVDITCGCATPISLATRIGIGKLIENCVLLGATLLIYNYGRPWISFRR